MDSKLSLTQFFMCNRLFPTATGEHSYKQNLLNKQKISSFLVKNSRQTASNNLTYNWIIHYKKPIWIEQFFNFFVSSNLKNWYDHL